MGLILLLLLIGVPTLEIFVFIEVGGKIGLFNTLAIVFVTAALGAYLLRSQGLSVLNRVQQNLAANQLPVNEIFDGVFLLIAGVMLLTPGFVTDGVGFLLFVPPLRSLLRLSIIRHLSKKGHTQAWSNATPHEPQQHSPTGTNQDDIIIDGNFEEIDPDQKELENNSNPTPKNPWSHR
jgi:UPF0716 protein FxsA